MTIRTSTLALSVVGALLSMGAARGQTDVSVDGGAACVDCHDEIVETFTSTPHWTLDRDDRSSLADATTSCESCHGDTTSHLEEGGGADTIFNFGDHNKPAVNSERCQTCHKTEHPRFDATSHAQAGLDCISCHTVHGTEAVFSQLQPWPNFHSSVESARVSGSCLDCHTDIFSQFEFNERHRLQEGILDCTTCHDPHEPANRGMLGGFKQAACADCHTDKTGPFIFEHAANRVEGCVSCHSAHGSVNRHMLTFQNVADQCYSCHATVPGFHAFLGPETQCTNCHSSIHGSNFDPYFLK